MSAPITAAFIHISVKSFPEKVAEISPFDSGRPVNPTSCPILAVGRPYCAEESYQIIVSEPIARRFGPASKRPLEPA